MLEYKTNKRYNHGIDVTFLENDDHKLELITFGSMIPTVWVKTLDRS